MTGVNVVVMTDEAEKAFADLAKSLTDMKPALKAIGESLVESTKQRFIDSEGPDGVKWKPNKPSTLARKKSRKPLVGESLMLGEQIHTDVIGDDTLIVGSSMEYAAMQQFGGTKSEFTHLWGDIPARPFIGLSDADQGMIEETIREHLERALR